MITDIQSHDRVAIDVEDYSQIWGDPHRVDCLVCSCGKRSDLMRSKTRVEWILPKGQPSLTGSRLQVVRKA